jgi:hypothetical protein
MERQYTAIFILFLNLIYQNLMSFFSNIIFIIYFDEVTIQAFDQKLQSPHVSVNLHTISAFQNMKPQGIFYPNNYTVFIKYEPNFYGDVVLKICSKFMESEITCSYASFQLQKEKAAFPTKELVSPTTSCANKTFAEDSSKKIKGNIQLFCRL